MRIGLIAASALATSLLVTATAGAQLLSPNLIYTAIQPCRLVDTRIAGGALTPGTLRQLNVVGVGTPGSLDSQGGNPQGCPIPGLDSNGSSQVQALMLNLVAVGPAGAGDLRAWPAGEPVPNASVINYSAGTNLANGIILPVRQGMQGGDVTVRADVSATHLVVDVLGYLSNGSAVQGTDNALNLFLGDLAGNQTVATGPTNTGIGQLSLAFLTAGFGNTALGSKSLNNTTTGDSNTAVGMDAMFAASTGSSNTALGSEALLGVVDGCCNVALGTFSSSNIVHGSSNIHISANSAADESNTIRIGTQGSGFSQQNRIFVAGINGATVVNPSAVLIDPVSGQLGAGPTFGASYSGGAANALTLNGTNSIGTWLNLGNGDSGGKTWSLISTGSGNGEGAGKLLLHDSTDVRNGLELDGAGNVTVPALAGSGNRAVYSDPNGNLTNSASDVRLKKDVVDLPDEIDILATLARLRAVAFHWDTSQPRARSLGSQREIGMIAQEVEQVLPQLVGTGTDGYESLDYPKLAAFLVEVAKLQQRQLDDLRQQVERLTALRAAPTAAGAGAPAAAGAGSPAAGERRQ